MAAVEAVVASASDGPSMASMMTERGAVAVLPQVISRWFRQTDSRPQEKERAMTIEIKRGGESTGYWSDDGWDVEVLHNTPGKNIEIRFSIASKGGGTTNVIVCVNSDSFGQITNAMMKADADRAIKAFESAMRAGH